MRSAAQPLRFTLNGCTIATHVDPARRLADLLRDDLMLTGTKIGCDAGDCGACTVLLDERQVCAWTRAARCRRCKNRFFATARRNAASARRAC
jgi:aerobic-type carbon monoxide dehydrogenase small subunit (CoxS/CutS family)